MITKLRLVPLALAAFVIPLCTAGARPLMSPAHATYVGVLADPPPEMSRRPEVVLTYMTGPQMKAQVVSLTGFSDPVFDQYASVLGTYDPATGQRTADAPSLLSVLFMQQIAQSIASDVLAREEFLDDNERVVFSHTDLGTSPTDSELDTFLDALHTRWLGLPAGPVTTALLHQQFRTTEKTSGVAPAYGSVLTVLLQHGGLYFY